MDLQDLMNPGYEEDPYFPDLIGFTLTPKGLTKTRQCECCLLFKPEVEKRHRNTAYAGDMEECNYMVACDDCFQIDCEYWEEMWKDYYAGCM